MNSVLFPLDRYQLPLSERVSVVDCWSMWPQSARQAQRSTNRSLQSYEANAIADNKTAHFPEHEYTHNLDIEKSYIS